MGKPYRKYNVYLRTHSYGGGFYGDQVDSTEVFIGSMTARTEREAERLAAFRYGTEAYMDSDRYNDPTGDTYYFAVERSKDCPSIHEEFNKGGI